MRNLFILLLLLAISTSLFAQYAGEIPLVSANASFRSDGADDLSGHHVTIVPDINDDGYDEVLITAPQRDIGTVANHGEVYLFYGRSAGFTGNINLSNADAVFFGDAIGNEASHDSYGIGDVDDDGYNDFAISIKKTLVSQGGNRLGKVYLFFGSGTKKSGRISLENADASLLGDNLGAEAAHVKGVGDLNKDGYDDIIVGAGFNTVIGADAGKVYVFFGKPRGQWGKNQDMEAVSNASYLAEAAGDWAGHRVSSIGDVDDDGFNDFLVGADKGDNGETVNAGKVYLIRGKNTNQWAKNVSLANADASWIGAFNNDNQGWGVGNNIGDIDGDGKTDIIFNTRRSKYYVILGKNIQFVASQVANDVADIIFTHSTNVWDNIGHDVSSAGDINKDGFGDFIIGNSNYNANGKTGSGGAFLFLGKASWPSNVSMNDADAIFTGENENDGAGFSVSGSGDVNGDDTDDLLISAWKNDDGAVDAGKTYLFLTQPLSFRVVSPNGGELYYANQTATIRWVKMDGISNVRIDYSLNNGSNWTSVASNAPNTGTYEWTVPSQTSTQCLVRIRDAQDGDPTDTSDNVFEISDASGLTVDEPNGGEYLIIGNSYDVKWTAFNSSGQVMLEASRDNGTTWETIEDSTPDDGTYQWMVNGPTSNNCLVRITDADGSPSDVSNEVFSIIETPTLTVVYPNGGESVSIDDPLNVQWTSENTSGTVKIELSRDGGFSFKTIASNYSDTGSWPWTATGPESDQCIIRISDTNGLVSDNSDSPFTITAAAALTVISPNGGEQWGAENIESIAWSASQVIENVKVELSRDNGAAWEVIQESTPNDGSLEWMVTEPITTNALVKITEILNPYKLDLSLTEDHSVAFEGEDWTNAIDNDIQGWDGTVTDQSGTSYAVFGFSGGSEKEISRVRLLTDTGVQNSNRWVTNFTVATSLTMDNFQTVFTGTKTGGDWQEFDFDPVVAKYVKLSLNSPAGTKQLGEFQVWVNPVTPAVDVSDAVFEIKSEKSLAVTSPNGGEEWFIGEGNDITWKSIKGGPNVKIELSRDNGTAWTTLVESTENDGVWNFDVNGPSSKNCLVRVSDPTVGLTDVSDGKFEIDVPPAITVTAPNGGEVLYINDVSKITWTFQNTSDAVKILLSRNNGASYGTISDSTANDGEFDWTIGGPPSQTCLVKVVDYAGATEDESDAAFEIQPKPSITVITPNGGETTQGGDKFLITWLSVNAGGTVNIDLSRDNGQTWEIVIHDKSDNGRYNWPVSGAASDNSLIRVSAPSGEPSDVSDAIFTILDEPAIAVVEPNGGEIFFIGSSFNVLWNNVNFTGPVKIDLSRDNGQSWNVLTASTENDGDFLWDIKAPASDNCLIKVTGLDGGPTDNSDAVFSIQPVPAISVTVPNGGEKYFIGAIQPIEWDAVNISESVKIELSRDGGENWTTLEDSAPDSGKYNWTVEGPESDNCFVRVSDADGDPIDTSDAAFIVLLEPAIIVTQPNGNDIWYLSTSQSIEWGSVNTSGSVKFSLSRDNGQTWETIVESMPDSGSYEWPVSGDTSAFCLVKVSDVAGGLEDQSDSVFAIEELPQLTVLSPNGGELYYISDPVDLTWSSVNTSDLVNIELSQDNGATWTSIITDTEDDGSFEWTVESDTSSICLIRMSDADGSPVDVSDSTFTIELKPGITITSPTGGELWTIGTEQLFTWTSVNTSGLVNIDLSRDNNKTWEMLAESVQDTGSYKWTVEGPASDSCIIKISDSNSGPSDISDSTFAIEEEPTITVTAPNGGEMWELGSEQTVSWNSINIGENVFIQLSRDAGATWETLAENAENSESWLWNVAGETSDSCLIKVSSLDNTVMDVSDSLFQIYLAPVLTLESPNGGDNWQVGLDASITWSANYDIGTVSLLVSRDSGESWERIAQGQPVAEGIFSYKVTDPISDSCLVKVKDDSSALEDVSDEIFVISYQTGVYKAGNLIPENFALLQNYPNPFNPTTKVTYQLPKQSDVELTIYNLKGEFVRQLVNQTQAAGVYETVWDGRDSVGNLTSSGIYFYRIKAGDYTEIRRLTFMK